MTLLLVFLAAVFTIFALWRAVAPFLGDQSESLHFEYFDDAIREIELLSARRTVLLAALRELEFERETYKLGADDHERFRRRYETEAVQILRRLDELHGGKGWRDRVNSQLEERLGTKSRLADIAEPYGPPAERTHVDDEPEHAPDEQRSEADEIEEVPDNATGDGEPDNATGDSEPDSATGDSEPAEQDDAGDEDAGAEQTCSSCGEPLEANDRFCSQCGTPTVAVPEDPPSASEVSA